MCNEYANRVSADEIHEAFAEIKIPLRIPEGIPNLEPRDSVKITDKSAILRTATDDVSAAELVVRRWSWPAPNGKPVYNFRSEGRNFGSNRCLIVVDGFYEFTDATPVEGGAKKPPKSKWLFTMRDEPWFCIAGIWRTDPKIGEAYTMLTTEPGPDIAPYHNRQVVVLGRNDWAYWLNPATPPADVLRPTPAGTLEVTQVR